jgi:uncharacterized membrane protein YozB (DUF420 family)
MDEKLLFWAFSLFWMTLLVVIAFRGRRAVLRGDFERHRRLMHWAALFVAVFLVSYIAKVLFLGKEDLALWSPGDRLMLYIHETFVLIMVIVGGLARFLARLFPGWGPGDHRRHQWAGRIAIGAGFFGLLTAALVFVRMIQRSGLL